MPVSSSSATLTGIAFLRNPKQVGKSKTWIFEGSIYLVVDDSGQERGVTLLMCYFNDEDFYFGPAGVAHVSGSIAKMRPDFDLGSTEFDHDDYPFVVDVDQLIPLHETTFETMNTADNSGKDKVVTPKEPTVRLPQIKMSFRPHLIICGLPSNLNDIKSTFDMDAEMYTQFGRAYCPFPVSCWIIDSVAYLREEADAFPWEMDVTNVAYLGFAPKAAGNAKFSTPSTPAPSQTAKREQNFIAGTPSWVSNKKHKGNDGSAALSSSPV
ncbi:hypothetical protein B0H17DRAFT_1337905 [Mycena rosella]|uniref:Uncharacterized protein n=1 Tax=Mycena rosella TaxID=1033263 RepID=A0AAD7CQM6_MYCRO|nr:hypothetical protein B0H17DRAFT_1337905 [Mycena rosella]